MRSLTSPVSRNFIESVLVLLLLLALIMAMVDTLRIFFGVFTFALIFYVSFTGVFEALVRLVKRRKLAAVLYSVVLVLLVALPFVYVITAMGKHVKDVMLLAEDVKLHGIPPLSPKVAEWPLIGSSIQSFWQHLQENPKETIMGYEQQLQVVLHHLLTGGAGVIGAAVQIMLGIIISAFMLAAGANVLTPVKATLQHLLGKRDGLSLLDATGHAIRGVSIGVMGTAFIATLLSWTGFAIAGLHFKILLAALVFFVVLIQVGPLIVWLPLVIWAALEGHSGMAIFLGIYGAAVLAADAVLKPVLIAKSGGKLPFLVLFTGVVGGLAAWGFTGMFKGAIIMAVFYTVFTSWLKRKQEPGEKTVSQA